LVQVWTRLHGFHPLVELPLRNVLRKTRSATGKQMDGHFGRHFPFRHEIPAVIDAGLQLKEIKQ